MLLDMKYVLSKWSGADGDKASLNYLWSMEVVTSYFQIYFTLVDPLGWKKEMVPNKNEKLECKRGEEWPYDKGGWLEARNGGEKEEVLSSKSERH